MSRQTHIFATRTDLEPGLKAIESSRPLKYVLSGMFESPGVTTYNSLLETDRLGINTTGSHITGDSYLVVDAMTEIKIEEVPQRKGDIRYAVSQLLNPTAISFRPGGLYQAHCLICGHIGTASENVASTELYRAFTRAIIRGFKKIGSYRVGPHAIQLMNEGTRLVTIGVNSPPEYDLKL